MWLKVSEIFLCNFIAARRLVAWRQSVCVGVNSFNITSNNIEHVFVLKNKPDLHELKPFPLETIHLLLGTKSAFSSHRTALIFHAHEMEDSPWPRHSWSHPQPRPALSGRLCPLCTTGCCIHSARAKTQSCLIITLCLLKYLHEVISVAYARLKKTTLNTAFPPFECSAHMLSLTLNECKTERWPYL